VSGEPGVPGEIEHIEKLGDIDYGREIGGGKNFTKGNEGSKVKCAVAL
jgi:hypothetical protein